MLQGNNVDKRIAVAESVMNTVMILKPLKSLPKKKINGKARRKHGRLIRKTAKMNRARSAFIAIIGAAEVHRIISTPTPKFKSGYL